MERRVDGFSFFYSYYEAISKLKSDSEKLRFLNAICEYAFYGTMPQMEDKLLSMFILTRPNIDASLKRAMKAKQNGSKGGAPQGNKNARKNNQKNNVVVQEKEKEKNRDEDDGQENMVDPSHGEGRTAKTDIDYEKLYTDRGDQCS